MICEGRLKSGKQCQCPATRGFHKRPATRCKRHMLPRMVRRPYNLMKCSVCEKTATFRSVPFEYRLCNKHYLEHRKKDIFKSKIITHRSQCVKTIKFVDHFYTYCQLCNELATNTKHKDGVFPALCVKHADPADTKYVAKWKRCVKCLRFTPFGTLCTEHKFCGAGVYDYEPEKFIKRECLIEHDCANYADHSYKDDPVPFACRLHAAPDMVINYSVNAKCVKCNKKNAEYADEDKVLPIYCVDCCPAGTMSTKTVYSVCDAAHCTCVGFYKRPTQARNFSCGMHWTSVDKIYEEFSVNICPDCDTLIDTASTHCVKHFTQTTQTS